MERPGADGRESTEGVGGERGSGSSRHGSIDHQTIDRYETGAARWEARRSPTYLDEARALAGRIEAAGVGGPTIDLGCGTGWYAPVLPAPVVALDAARSMLERAAVHAPAALAVQADLAVLPLRGTALAGAWARNSYVHLAQAHVPAALAELHRCLRPGAPVEITFFGGQGEGRDLVRNDDLPGRFFSLWSPDRLLDVVEGAGFDLARLVPRTGRDGETSYDVRAVRAVSLPDHVAVGMDMLVCGLNPSLYAAEAGVGYARPGNRFWPAALAAGLASRDRDPGHALRHHGLGMTDLVKRATVAASELTAAEYRSGFGRVERLAEWLAPGAVCFVGLAGWRAAVDRAGTAGPQERRVGGRPAYVMPSTSGLNARVALPELAGHLRAASRLARAPR